MLIFLLLGFKIGGHRKDSMDKPPLKVERNWAELDQQCTQFQTSFRED